MPRPADPDTLTLSRIDPDTLGRDLSAAVAHYAARLVAPMSPGYEVSIGACGGDTTVGLTAADLARYARGEGELDDAVESYAVELVPLLAGPLDEPGAIPATLRRWLRGELDVRDLSASSLADRLALVLTAALGREAIGDGDPVTVAQVAALAGLDPRVVRRFAAAGELVVTDGEVSAHEARRWLRNRKVAGL